MWVDLWPTVSLMSWIGTPLLLMIDTAVWRPSWACQWPMPARLVILLNRQLRLRPRLDLGPPASGLPGSRPPRASAAPRPGPRAFDAAGATRASSPPIVASQRAASASQSIWLAYLPLRDCSVALFAM